MSCRTASSVTDTESPPAGTSLASILGIKGGLRIRHHPINQTKAHAILRRVELSEDSSDDGQENNVVHFRLFTHKNLNLKPGKEILLTVASVDGRFKDQNVIFEGNFRGSDEDSDHEGTTLVEEESQVIEEEEEILPEPVMPPKMRRQWGKKLEEVSPAASKIPIVYSSVGVQAQPVYTSSCVQASTVQSSVSVQVQPSQSFASVQTCSSYVSSAVQADPPPSPSYASLDVQTDPILPSIDLATIRENEPVMEQTSTSSLQQSSAGSPFTIIPLLSLEIPSSPEPCEDMEMSPQDEISGTIPLVEEAPDSPMLGYPSPSPPLMVTDMFDLDDSPDPRASRPAPPTFVSGGFAVDFVGAVQLAVTEAIRVEKSEGPSTIHTDRVPGNSPTADSELPQKACGTRVMQRARKNAENQDVLPAAAVHPSVNNTEPTRSGIAASHETGRAQDCTQHSLLRSPVLPMSTPQRVQTPAQNAVTSISTASVPPNSPTADPARAPDSELPQKAHETRVMQRASKSAGTQDALPAAAVHSSVNSAEPARSSVAESHETGGARDESTLREHSLLRSRSPVLPMPAPQRARTPAQNAVASSSKAPLPEHTPLPSTSILPRGVALGRTKDKPVAAGTQQHQDFSDLTSSRSSTPPPEPKALARIPAGPSSNPLSIRPSHSSSPSTLTRLTISPTAAPKAKKPIVVGRGWPFVRASNPTLPVVSADSAGSKLAKSPLNGVAGYSSPSRSPPANPPANPASNWERIESEDVMDMDISNPPSPVTRPPSLPPPPADASASISESHRRASDNHDQVVLLEEARTDSASKLSRLSHSSSTFALLEQQLTESPVVPQASSSRTTSATTSQSSPAILNLPQTGPSIAPSSAAPSFHAANADSSNAQRNSSSEKQLLCAAPSVPTRPRRATRRGKKRPPETNHFTELPSLLFSSLQQSMPLPTHHPLPAKPPPPIPSNNVSFGAPRGMQRDRPRSPDLWTAPGVVRVAPRNDSSSSGAPRGIKRERPPSPNLWTAPGIVRVPPQNSNPSSGAPPGIKPESPPPPDLRRVPPHPPSGAPPGIKPESPPPPDLSSGAPRGIKRERPPSPDLWTAPGIVRVQPQRRTQPRRWPTVGWTHSDALMGDGDLGIRRIAFNSDGSCFAMSCMDRTLRIWNSRPRIEISRLSHNSQVIGLAWLDGDAAVMTFCEDGVLGKWARIGQQNQWQWGRVLSVDAEERAPGDDVCLTCARDRIAIAFPKTGVKVWMWSKGSWRAQRSITRTNVTALKFIDDGDALLGGTRDGVLWHCAVPNGTMKVYAFLKSITSIATNPPRMEALVTQANGLACLVKLGSQAERRVGQSFSEPDLRDGALGAVFAADGKTVVFGNVDNCLLVWDALKGAVLYGMEHPDGDMIQTVASYDGPEGGVVAGTQQGRLLWWSEPQPPVQSPSNSDSSRKRPKVK